MTTIPAAVARIIAKPAPVLILDTCNFLDLFRRDTSPPAAEGARGRDPDPPPNSCNRRSTGPMPSIWSCRNSCPASSPTMPTGSKENSTSG